MSFTYDEELPTDRDHVRFLIGDTVSADALLSDEEIAAVITEETITGKGRKYFVAAECLAVLLTRWETAGKGVMEKQISKLRKRYGFAGDGSESIRERIKELKARGQSYARSPGDGSGGITFLDVGSETD